MPPAPSPGAPRDALAPGVPGGELLEGVTDGILAVDRHWRITFLNAACEAVVGRPRAELLGRSLWAEFPELSGSPTGAALRQALRQGERASVADFHPRFEAWLEARAFAAEGGGLVIFLRDVTQGRRAEAERARLLEAERVAREAAERNAARLERLQALGARLSAARALEEVESLVGHSALEASEAHAAVTALPLPGGAHLRLNVLGRVREPGSWPCEVPLEASLPLSEAFRAGEALFLESPYAFAGRYPRLLPELLERTFTRAAAVLPLAVEGRTLGVLCLCFPEARPFTPADRDFLLALARHCSLAVERLRLLGEAEAQRARLQQAVDDVARSEERLRSLVMATSDIIWEMPPGGEFTLDQPGWRAFTGQSAEALRGWGWLEAVHPDDRQATVSLWLEALASRSPLVCEHRLRRHDGVYRHMLVRAVPVLEADGRVREWVGLHRDITAQREDEAERARLLMRARRHGAQLQGLASASLAISEADTVERVLRVITEQAREVIGAHQAITRLTGIEGPAGEALSVSEKYSEWRGFDARPDGSGLYARVCRLNRPVRLTQAELEAHPGWRGLGGGSGEPAPLRGWLAAPLVSRSGRNLGFIQLSDRYEGDFTAEDEAVLVQLARMASVALENARLMAETQAANRAKDEFLAVMSHELRTPLTAVLGWTQMLRARRNDAAALDKGLGVIERNARTLAQLIEDVLDVSRIITGKLALNRRVMDLVGVVAAAAEVVRPHAEQKGVAVVVDTQVGTGLLLGDGARLQQVFWNLLVNAVKFTPAGGRVEVALRRGEDAWEVSVKDTGQGIRPEFLTRLFERFWQADGSSTREHGGLGLGLAIVHHLVGLHGGRVSAHSEGEGRGSTFTVRLPVPAVLAEPEAEGAAGAEALAALRLDGVQVLLVEDAPDAKELIAMLLRERGARVRTTASAQEALRALEEGLPDVLVSDIGLPGEDGHSLLKRVREWAEARGAWVPAIALTAYAGPEDVRRAYRAGFQVHLSKPLEPAALLESVARLATRDGDTARAV